MIITDFPGSSDGKESSCNAGDSGLIPGSGRSPEERNGYPLQYSCLENPMDRGPWWATAYEGHKELDMTELLTLDLIIIIMDCCKKQKRVWPLAHAIQIGLPELNGLGYSLALTTNKRASLVDQMVKRLSAMQETQGQPLGWEDPLKKEMAAHSSILAGKIPWTVDPGRLPSMGSQRVGHDWATSLHYQTL